MREYGRDEKLLQGVWVAGPFPGPDVEAWARSVIAQARAGWTDAGGIHGGGLVIDEEQLLVGLIYLSPTGKDGIEVSYGVAPPKRGRGIATRALRLITDWALGQAKFARVELHISQNHAASRRVAERAGFHLRERIETMVQATGETYTDLVYARE